MTYNPKVSKILVTVLIAAVSAVVLGVVIAPILLPSRRFREQVKAEMTKAEVIDRVGEPSVRLTPGDVVPRWGNTPEHDAIRESWIYFVFPESQHRFVVSFKEGKVEAIEYDRN